ncbi:MAG: hypothetical protein GY929_13745 [Actinomycetia bacterium]|nr:hypothetical protein [Actinomycetes bacterium]
MMSEIGWLEPLAWVGAGAGVGAAVLVGMRAVVLHRFRGSRLRQQARAWERVTEAADGLSDPMLRAAAGHELLRLFNTSATRSTALDAAVTVIRTRAETRTILRQVVAESQIPAWLTDQLTAGEGERRVAAIELIGVLLLPGMSSLVATLLADDDETIRTAAGSCLARINPAMAVGTLIGRLERGDQWAGEPLAEALAALGRPVDVADDRLTRLAPQTASAAALTSAPTAVEREPGARRAVARLVPMLASEDGEIRMSALTALGDLHHPMAAMALAAAVGSGDRITRFAAGIRLTETQSGMVLLRDLARRDQEAAGDTARIVLWGAADRSGRLGEPLGPQPTTAFGPRPSAEGPDRRAREDGTAAQRRPSMADPAPQLSAERQTVHPT